MAVSRIRKVQSQREHDSTVDDFVTQGFEVLEQGESTTMLRKKTWGSFVGHSVVAVLTLWWTLGLGNLTYALIVHYTAEKVLVRTVQPASIVESSDATTASTNGVSPSFSTMRA